MRPFQMSDLEWLQPLASQYGEWKALLETLPKCEAILVEEPYAIAALYMDEHGMGLAGLADEKGIKTMIRLLVYLKNEMQRCHIALHGHWQRGSWQERLAIKHGFKINGEGYHVLEME